MKLRLLIANSRGLAAAAVAALALGIGITALMFAIVDGTVRRGLPVERASEVVHLERIPPPGGADRRVQFLNSEREALSRSGAMAAIAGYTRAQTVIAADGLTPRRWLTGLVTANTFAILGASAAQGRVLDGQSTAGGAVPVLLSDVAWRQQFGADPAIVGRAIRANGLPAVIVGVMPPAFRFPIDEYVWRPLDERSATTSMSLWGRLAAGQSDDAAGRLSAAYAQTPTARMPQSPSPARIGVAPYTAFQLQPVVTLLETMFLAGMAVLAIACLNVANLLLARGLARRRDFAIAGALGASRGRIMRERVREGLALAAPAAVLGVGLAYAGAAMFSRAIAASSPPPPYWVSVVVDVRVLAYASAAALLSALLASAIPAWRSGSAAVTSLLADEGRGSTSGTMRRTAAALVVVEVALATSVLIAAGLMTKGVARLAAAQYPFAVEDVTTMRVALPARVYPDSERRRAFFETLYSRLGTLPGAQASLSSSFPFAFERSVPFMLDRGDAAGTWPEVNRVVVSPGHFATLRVNLIGGRDFEVADRIGRPPVAIVNLSFALKYARREDLIGRSLRLESAGAPPVTIVGIAPDLAVGNARGERPEAVYVPLFQQTNPDPSTSLLARGADESQLRALVAGIDPELPLDRVTTIAAFRHGVTWYYRVFGFLLLAFGLGALVLALVGVYAVMSFGVTRRRREIGTRMAFGATRRDIVQMLLREGSLRLTAGLIAGGLLAAWLTPRLALFLFQVSPRDASVYTIAAAVVASVGLAAYTIPAIRASRLDPNACLRED